MSVRELIDYLDSMRVNTVSDEQKLRWIADFERLAKASVLDRYFVYDLPELSLDSTEEELIIKPPFQRLYILYMLAMLSFEMDSREEYNSYIDGYNYEMACFMDYIARNNRVISSGKILVK